MSAVRDAKGPKGEAVDVDALRDEANELAAALAPGGRLTVPEEPRLLVDDTTPEKQADLMARNHMRLAVLSAEAGPFRTIDDPYQKSGGGGLELYLKAHAGDDMAYDRLSREALSLVAPALTLGLAVQEAPLRKLGKNDDFRGRGLHARFLYGWPASRIGYRNARTAPAPDAVAARYGAVIRGLLALPVERTTLHLEAAAQEALLAFSERLEVRLRPDGDLVHVMDWASKLTGAVARIAGICHAVERQQQGYAPWGAEIREATINRAILMAEQFLIPHALAAFGEMGADPELAKARRVLETVQRLGTAQVTRRDLHDRMRRGQGFAKPDDLNAPLALLVQFGWLRPAAVPAERQPGRPSLVFDVHPQALAEYPQNPHKGPEVGGIADFADSFFLGADGDVAVASDLAPAMERFAVAPGRQREVW